MTLTFDLLTLSGRLAGIADAGTFKAWALGELVLSPEVKPAKTKFLPMMTARRMCTGSRFAADLALELCKEHEVSAAVFCSRHGELERNFNIQSAIAADGDVSPTDFAMSVHNAAAGSFSIVGRKKIPITSISAGKATFPQALIAAVSLLKTHGRILLVDFDSYIPEFFKRGMHEQIPDMPYAVGMILTAGSHISCTGEPGLSATEQDLLPCSLKFGQALYRRQAFTFDDGVLCWSFNCKNNLLKD